MILPMTIRLNRGSYPGTLPKPMGISLKLDEVLDEENKTTQLITEEVDGGILLRHPTPGERTRFDIK